MGFNTLPDTRLTICKQYLQKLLLTSLLYIAASARGTLKSIHGNQVQHHARTVVASLLLIMMKYTCMVHECPVLQPPRQKYAAL